jgi:hypothetical protein
MALKEIIDADIKKAKLAKDKLPHNAQRSNKTQILLA